MYRGYASTTYKLGRALGPAMFVEMGLNPFSEFEITRTKKFKQLLLYKNPESSNFRMILYRNNMKLLGNILIILAVLVGCKKQETTTIVLPATPAAAPSVNPADTITYLALGDSYTIGQSVPSTQSFPFKITSQLKNNHYKVADPVIIAQTGWTTTDLKRAIADANLTKKYSFVTLLIGVNNQYQNDYINSYKTDFDDLVNTAISYAKGINKHVFVLSIPDYSVTPFALTSGRDTATIRTQIDQYNAINESESNRLGVNYLNITGISRMAKTNTTLLANDGLHPSGLMYLLWVNKLTPLVLSQLK